MGVIVPQELTEPGVSAKTIRFYEEAGLMPQPLRTSAGYRDHPEEATSRLSLHPRRPDRRPDLGRDLRRPGHPRQRPTPRQHVTGLIDDHLARIEQHPAELEQARQAPHALRRRAQATDPADCAGERVCSILAGPTASEPQPGRADHSTNGGRTDAHNG
ncbi:MerR family DNA-binding transcriptional regulator [Nonomuraea turkmeniaca]|uniref:MerR family DNA-binding transcriptional regulator n=1 Tax=Nonomuraea turkmeniaca TaxID=103838 RepID=UPI001B8720E2|nr:MerR family DNA-binding transcriptional regulator [Nonomuraea turkmeniaca]